MCRHSRQVTFHGRQRLAKLAHIKLDIPSFQQAFNVVLLSLLAMLPSPIVYGGIIDNTCILWQETCDGGTGNCLLYDTVKLRLTLMITTGKFGLKYQIKVQQDIDFMLITLQAMLFGKLSQQKLWPCHEKALILVYPYPE